MTGMSGTDDDRWPFDRFKEGQRVIKVKQVKRVKKVRGSRGSGPGPGPGPDLHLYNLCLWI